MGDVEGTAQVAEWFATLTDGEREHVATAILQRLRKGPTLDANCYAEQALSAYVAFEAAQLTAIHEGIADAGVGRFASREESEAIANRYRAYRVAPR